MATTTSGYYDENGQWVPLPSTQQSTGVQGTTGDADTRITQSNPNARLDSTNPYDQDTNVAGVSPLPPPAAPPPQAASPPPAAPPPLPTQPGRPGPDVPRTPPAAQPPPAAPPPPAPSLLATPGAYELWLKQHAGDFDTPTNAEGLYGKDYGPTAISQVHDIGPGIYQGGAQGYIDSLSGPGSAETLGETAAERLGGTLPMSGSASMGAYGDARGALSGAGAMEAAYGDHGSEPWQTGATENFAANNHDLDTAGAMEAFFGKYGEDPMKKGYSEGFVENSGKDLETAGDMEDFYRRYGSDPLAKGYTENLYESGIGQLDPYYDYASKRAISGAQTASAARGGFNSGLAAQQESDILGNLRGQQASKWVDLAPIADAAHRSRMNDAADWARSSQDSEQSRFKTLSDAYGAADEAKLGRETLGFDAANDAETQAINRYNSREKTATDADAAKLDREKLGFDAARSAQDSEQNRYRTLSDIASAGDAADLGLTNARITADRNASDAALQRSKQAEDALINRTKTSADISRSAEDQALQEWLANAGLAQTTDATNLSLRKQTDAEAAAADAARRTRILDSGDLMRNLQTTGQNRILGGLNETQSTGNAEADLIAKIFGDMKDVNAPDDAWLQAEADKYGMSLQQMKDMMGFKTSVGGLIAKGYGVG